MYRHVSAIFVFLFFGGSLIAQTTFTLKQAIRTSSENNVRFKVEKFNLNTASSDIVTAGLRPNPVFNNQSLFLLRNSLYPQGTTMLHNANRQMWYQVTKPIQLGNIRQRKIDLAQQNYALTELVYSDAARNLYYEVANQWLDIWLAKVNRVILLDAKDNIDTLVDINKNRLKNQAITNTELIRTQLLSDQYILQVKTLNLEYANQLRSFRLLLGRDDSLDINNSDSLLHIQLVENTDSLLAIARNRRQDFKASESSIQMANKNIQLQRALSAPYLEAGVVYNPQNSVPYAGTFATLSIPLFDRNQGEIQKSKFQLEQSKTSLAAKDLQLQQEVGNSFNTYIVNKQNLVYYKDIVKQSQKVLSTVRYSYLKGNTTIIDFLEAQRSYLETQRIYYQAVYNFRKSYVDLLFVTGLIMDLNN